MLSRRQGLWPSLGASQASNTAPLVQQHRVPRQQHRVPRPATSRPQASNIASPGRQERFPGQPVRAEAQPRVPGGVWSAALIPGLSRATWPCWLADRPRDGEPDARGPEPKAVHSCGLLVGAVVACSTAGALSARKGIRCLCRATGLTPSQPQAQEPQAQQQGGTRLGDDLEAARDGGRIARAEDESEIQTDRSRHTGRHTQ